MIRLSADFLLSRAVIQWMAENAKEETVMEITEKKYPTPLGAIHYWVRRVSDDRPWLVFLPGLTADHRLFDRQMEGLGGRYNCLTWDAPAHGLSRPFALQFSMGDMAEYLHGILTQEGIRNPVLVGQSLGGYLSQVYLTRYPDAVSGFISIDSCSLHRRYYTAIELFLLKHTGPMYRCFPWKVLTAWGPRGTAETDYGRRLMEQMMASYQKEEYCALADHGFRIFAEAVEADPNRPIPCPLLLLCGEKDAAGSARRYNRNWVRQEGVPLIWVPAAGHNSNTDAPEFVNAQIEKFVSSLKAGIPNPI